MKICTICKAEKEESEYNKNKSRKDGLNTLCKDCSQKRSRRYYEEKGEEHKKNVIRRNKKHRKALQEFILDYLSSNPCKDCGNSDLRVLEFDHLPEFEKKRDISRMIAASVSISTLQSEIIKCEVVCCNCHKIRTYSRRKSYRNGKCRKEKEEIAGKNFLPRTRDAESFKAEEIYWN